MKLGDVMRALSDKEAARLRRKHTLTSDDRKLAELLSDANDERAIPPWMRAEAELDARILGAREGGGR